MSSDFITKPAIKRLASVAGVVRISGTVYSVINDEVNCKLSSVIQDAYIFMHADKRKGLSFKDVLAALEEKNISLTYSPLLKKTMHRAKGIHKKRGSDKAHKFKPARGGVKKPHRFKPGTAALRDIRRRQKEVEKLYIPKARFARHVKRNAADFVDTVRISPDAILTLQIYVEDLIIMLLKDANLQAIHAGRKTIMDSDILIVKRITATDCN